MTRRAPNLLAAATTAPTSAVVVGWAMVSGTYLATSWFHEVISASNLAPSAAERQATPDLTSSDRISEAVLLMGEAVRVTLLDRSSMVLNSFVGEVRLRE